MVHWFKVQNGNQNENWSPLNLVSSGATTVQNEDVSVGMNLLAWTSEHEQIYLEYFNDGDKIFLEYPNATQEWHGKYFSTCTWMKV
jgi:hypothetical protein